MSEPAPQTAAPPEAEGPPSLHTSQLSILVGLLVTLKHTAIPLLLVGFGSGGVGLIVFIPVIAAIAAVSGLFAYLSWKRFTYTIGVQDIRVESGVLSRAARSVPYERIQDVSLEQKFVPRLLGLVSVKFETGAGGADDLALSYLTEDAGEELRQLVRARRDAQEAGEGAAEKVRSPEQEEVEAEPIFAMGTPRLFRFGIFEFSLAVFAVLGGLLQYADSLIDFEIWDSDLWTGVIEEQGSTVASFSTGGQILGAIGGILVLLFIGSATGMVRVFARDWGFLLERTERGFRRRRGLFTKTDVVMPIHRVQAISIGTRMIRYRFGWHNLSFVSLAQDAGSSSHVVAPFAKMDEIDNVVETAGFRLPDAQTQWHHASPKYRTDSMIIDSLFFVVAGLVAGVVLAIFNPGWVLPVVTILIGFAVLFAGAALYSWQFKRHALDDTQIMSRAGLLSPQSQIATRMKLHSVEVSQGPLARLRGYATLHLGLAGGTFAIPGVPIERALDVRRKVLETIAATDFSALENA